MPVLISTNIDSTNFGIPGIARRSALFRQAEKEMVEDIAKFAADALRFHIPKGNTLRASDAVFFSRASPVLDYRGFSVAFLAEAGVDEVTTEADESPLARKYPLFLSTGTGRYERTGDPLARGGDIYAPPGKVFAFEKEGGEFGGEKVFTRTIKGMEPDMFVEKAVEETNAYTVVQIRKLKAAFKYLV